MSSSAQDYATPGRPLTWQDGLGTLLYKFLLAFVWWLPLLWWFSLTADVQLRETPRRRAQFLLLAKQGWMCALAAVAALVLSSWPLFIASASTYLLGWLAFCGIVLQDRRSH